MQLFSLYRRQHLLRPYVFAQIQHLKPIGLQQHLHNVFSNVVDVALHGGQSNPPLPAVPAGALFPQGPPHQGKGTLRRLRAHEQLGQKQRPCLIAIAYLGQRRQQTLLRQVHGRLPLRQPLPGGALRLCTQATPDGFLQGKSGLRARLHGRRACKAFQVRPAAFIRPVRVRAALPGIHHGLAQGIQNGRVQPRAQGQGQERPGQLLPLGQAKGNIDTPNTVRTPSSSRQRRRVSRVTRALRSPVDTVMVKASMTRSRFAIP